MIRTRLNVRCSKDPNKPSKFDASRAKAREAIKNANIKRIEFEKQSIQKLQEAQVSIKQIVKDDIQLIKFILDGKFDDI